MSTTGKDVVKNVVIPAMKAIHNTLRTPIEPSPGISKSQAGAMRCPKYLAGHYLQKRGASPRESSTVMETGIAFHAWRADYLRHLRDSKQWEDPPFVDGWLAAHPVSADADYMIRKDAKTFRVDPQLIYDVELFITLDSDGNVIETIEDHPPGVPSDHPLAFAYGQPDCLHFDGKQVVIPDYKSGYSTENVGDDEPKVYAALAFALFPGAQRVLWLWDYVRCGMERAVPFERSDLPEIWARLRVLVAQKQEIIRAWNAGEEVEANPFSGHCRYCPLYCEQRSRAENGELAIAPIRSELDFERLCGLIVGMETLLPQARRLARQFLNDQENGRYALDDKHTAELKTTSVRQIPLDRFLAEMGLAVVDISALGGELKARVLAEAPTTTPLYDVKLSSLTVGKTSAPASAKKRAGMRDVLNKIAVHRPKTTFRITKQLPAGNEENLLGNGSENSNEEGEGEEE